MAPRRAPISQAMLSEQPQGPYRWRRAIAACGVLTSIVALAAMGNDGQPRLVSLWLLFAGVALAALSVHAVRKERRAGELLARRQAERDQAESLRRAAETRSMELAETSPDIVSVHGPDGRMVSVSPASRAVLGYDPEELIGRSGDDFVLGEDVPIILAMRNRAREADDVSGTFRMVRRDGTAIWVEAKLHIVRDAGGKVAETHVIVRDVHERVEAQRAPGRGRGALPHRLRGGRRRHGDRQPRRAPAARQPRAVRGHRPPARRARGPHDALAAAPRRPRPARRGERPHALRADRHRARRAPLPARRRPRRLGVRLDHARARRRRRPPALPDPGPRRHRAPPLRGRAAPHGRPRRADRPAQPPLVRARARPPRRPRRPLRPARRRDPDRRRPVQERQRHARPQRRRPADRQGRRRAARPPARRRGDRPPGRRRVRRARARRRPRGRALDRRGPAGGDPRGPHLQPVRPPAQRQRLDRRRAVRLAPPDRRGRARQRRPGDVRGQGGRPRPRRLPHGRQGRAEPARLAAVVDRRDPRRARRGAARAPGAADHGPRHRATSTSTSCCCGCATRSAS